MNKFKTTELIGKTSRLLTNNLAGGFLAEGVKVTTEQWIILHILSSGSKSQKELAHFTLKNKASVNSLISNLISQALVTKPVSSTDKRTTVIEITPKGKIARQNANGIATEAVNLALDGFSVDELNQLNHFLDRIKSNIINK